MFDVTLIEISLMLLSIWCHSQKVINTIITKGRMKRVVRGCSEVPCHAMYHLRESGEKFGICGASPWYYCLWVNPVHKSYFWGKSPKLL